MSAGSGVANATVATGILTMLGCSQGDFAPPVGTFSSAAEVIPLTLLAPFVAPGERPLPTIEFRYPMAPTAPGSPVRAAAAHYPLILYFSGWPGGEIDNRAMLDELVSLGFAVLAFTYPARAPGMTDAEFQRVIADVARPMDFSTVTALRDTTLLFELRVQQRARDATAALDLLAHLQTLPAAGAIGSLDLQHVGALGFSLGGAVANHLCVTDARVKSAIDLDATHWIDAPDSTRACVLLFVSEMLAQPDAAATESTDPLIREGARMDRDDFARIDATIDRYRGTHVSIAHTQHLDFSDHLEKSPLTRLLHRRISAHRMQVTLDLLVSAFFNDTLRPDAARQFAAATARSEGMVTQAPRPTAERPSATADPITELAPR